jgi:hypothetical protein
MPSSDTWCPVYKVAPGACYLQKKRKWQVEERTMTTATWSSSFLMQVNLQELLSMKNYATIIFSCRKKFEKILYIING